MTLMLWRTRYPVIGWRLRSLEAFEPITFAPLDIRIYVRLALLILVWKLASQDYTGLAFVAERGVLISHVFSWQTAVAVFLHRRFLASAPSILACQLAAIAICVFAIAKPSRGALGAVLATAGLIEWVAYSWRGMDWDLNLPILVLAMVIIAPCSLKHALSSSCRQTPEANIVGWMLAVYIALMYFFAGLSKPMLSLTWFSDVQFGNNWRTQFLDAAPYGPVSNVFGELFSYAFISFPALASLIAFIVMIDQILLPLALFHRHFRVVGPLIVFMNHLGIALALGIFFSSMPVLGPAIFVPWSRLTRPRDTGLATRKTLAHIPLRFVFGCGVSAALCIAPALTHTAPYPIPDNFIFGWTYPKPEIYRAGGHADWIPSFVMGYFNEKTGKYEPLPRGYGGFMESYLTNYLNWMAAAAIKSGLTPAVLERITTGVCLFRPRNSNQYLLGPLALPEHRWSQFPDFDFASVRKLYVLEAMPHSEDFTDRFKPIRVTWKPVLSFEKPICS